LDPAQQAQQDQSGVGGGFRQAGPHSGASKVEELSSQQQKKQQLQQEQTNPYRSLGALLTITFCMAYDAKQEFAANYAVLRRVFLTQVLSSAQKCC
jgi:hypothetical protein